MEGSSPKLFDDINLVDNSGQTPIFKILQGNCREMLKFLMRKQCDVTIKDQRGDTIKDAIKRYSNEQMLRTYEKEEIKLYLSRGPPVKDVVSKVETYALFSTVVKWYYRNLMVDYSHYLLALFYCLLYGVHLWFVEESNKILVMIFHIQLILLTISAIILYRSSPGYHPQKHLLKDRNSNLVGRLLDWISKGEFFKIEESQDSYCFECLLIKPVHTEHCSKCHRCVPYLHWHSNFLGQCIGRDNARAYYAYLLLTTSLMAVFEVLALSASGPLETTTWVHNMVEGIVNLKNRSLILLAICIAVGLMGLMHFEKLILMTYAIGRAQSVNEIMHIWKYKHCFKVKSLGHRSDPDHEKSSTFVNKYVSHWSAAKRFCMFVAGRHK